MCCYSSTCLNPTVGGACVVGCVLSIMSCNTSGAGFSALKPTQLTTHRGERTRPQRWEDTPQKWEDTPQRWEDMVRECTRWEIPLQLLTKQSTVIVQLQELKHCKVVHCMWYRLLGQKASFREALSGKRFVGRAHTDTHYIAYTRRMHILYISVIDLPTALYIYYMSADILHGIWYITCQLIYYMSADILHVSWYITWLLHKPPTVHWLAGWFNGR